MPQKIGEGEYQFGNALIIDAAEKAKHQKESKDSKADDKEADRDPDHEEGGADGCPELVGSETP